VGGPACEKAKTQGLLKENVLIEPWISDPTAVAVMDHTVSPMHGSTVDQPHNTKGYVILSVHRRSHGPGRMQVGVAADSPECGGVRRRVRWRDPRSRCGASFRARVDSTCSWSQHAHIQGFKGATCASTVADTEMGQRGARRRAGAGAAACVDDRGWREVDAYHQETEKTNLPARKGLLR
jgi:hypothetical protein